MKSVVPPVPCLKNGALCNPVPCASCQIKKDLKEQHLKSALRTEKFHEFVRKTDDDIKLQGIEFYNALKEYLRRGQLAAI